MIASGAEAAELAGLASLLRRSGTTVECEVRGGSMGAAVPAGTTVRIRCDAARGAELGTVVAVLIAGELAVHRLVYRGRSSRARGWVVTEGDANLICDAPIRVDAVVGVVESVRNAEGKWEAVAIATPRVGRRRWIAAGVQRTMRAALELHPRFAQAMKGVVVLAMTPFVWWRPYPADRMRRASLAHRRAS